ncbi:MAG TPA: hypothetical protein VFM14_05735 [Gemmatimonadales bacterium]|nr:hypothetical protein [Gemmatimonadales bacterium]
MKLTHYRRPIVGIVGAADASAACLADAEALGAAVARQGWIVLTGGRDAGVMAAACAGAKQVPGSLTLGILPSTSGGANPHVDIAVFTGMGDGRNVVNVLTSDIVVACGVEGAGTASEVALALKSGKPVILLRAAASAHAFFGRLQGGEALLAADSVEQVIELIDTRVGERRPDRHRR